MERSGEHHSQHQHQHHPHSSSHKKFGGSTSFEVVKTSSFDDCRRTYPPSNMRNEYGGEASRVVGSSGIHHSSEVQESSSVGSVHVSKLNESAPYPAPFKNPSSDTRQYPTMFVGTTIPSSASAPLISSTALANLNNTGTSPQNGDTNKSISLRSPTSKIDFLKSWGLSTFKCTKQLMFERMGKSSRTVDTELESRIENLKELKKKYQQVHSLSRAFTTHFYNMTQTQLLLADAFSDLAQKSPELQQEFLFNASTQRNLQKNGDLLLSALNFFLSSVNTLCNKTIEDTIITINQYESSRIEYDAYRSDLEHLLQLSKPEGVDSKVEEAKRNFNTYKISYEKLRDDVTIKLQFLEENRIKVMHKLLLLLHNAICAYFSGNQQALESTMKQFSIKSPNSSSSSWLEMEK